MSENKNPGDQNVSLSDATYKVVKGVDGSPNIKENKANGKIMIGSMDEPSISVEAQYNPKELEIGKTVPWSKVNEANRANQGSSQNQGIHMEFTGAEGRSLSLEMLFDVVEDPSSTKVKTAVENLEKLASVRRPGSQEEQYKRPHRCMVVWGSTVSMSCVIDNLSIKYEMFSSDGTPLRARATVKLKEADVVSAKMPPRPRPRTPPAGGGQGGQGGAAPAGGSAPAGGGTTPPAGGRPA
jgi:hypothetical protein